MPRLTQDVINTFQPTRDILNTKTNQLACTVISRYYFAVDEIGQRTGLTIKGTAFPNLPIWFWGHDSLGQVASADSNLATNDRSYQYDSIGNVSEYLNSTGQVIAHFEYDPFGYTVVNTDSSNQFAYRFSTKPLDSVLVGGSIALAGATSGLSFALGGASFMKSGYDLASYNDDFGGPNSKRRQMS